MDHILHRKVKHAWTRDNLRFYEQMLRRAMSLSDAKRALGFPPDRNPSLEEIHKAYKSLAFQNHPDRGGDLAKMTEINVAKDVLEGKQRPSPEGGRPPPPAYAPQKHEPPPRQEKTRQVLWHEAMTKAHVPTSGVDWKFRSKVRSKSLDAETTNGWIAGYVVYGKAHGTHVFVGVEEYRYQSLYEHSDLHEYWMKIYEYPLTQKLRDLAPKVIRKLYAEMPHLKMNYDAKVSIYKEGVKFEEDALDKLSNIAASNIAFKDALLMMGEIDENDPWAKDRKLTVTVELGKKPGGDYDDYQVHITINGKTYTLRDESTKVFVGQAPPGKYGGLAKSIFGDYWYQGGKKTITKQARGNITLEYMVQHFKTEPAELLSQLQKAADQMKEKK